MDNCWQDPWVNYSAEEVRSQGSAGPALALPGRALCWPH